MLPELIIATIVGVYFVILTSNSNKPHAPPRNDPKRFNARPQIWRAAPAPPPAPIPVAVAPTNLTRVFSSTELPRVPKFLVEDAILPILENEKEEFKAAQSPRTSALRDLFERYAVAFLNSYGGRLWLGIHDSGAVMGIKMDRERHDALSLAFDHAASKLIQPQIDSCLYHIDWIPVRRNGVEIPDRQVVCITFKVPSNGHCVYTGLHKGAVMRASASVQRMSPSVVEERQRFGKPGSYTSALPSVRQPAPSKPSPAAVAAPRVSTANTQRGPHSPSKPAQKTSTNATAPVAPHRRPHRTGAQPKPSSSHKKPVSKSQPNRSHSKVVKKSKNFGHPGNSLPTPPPPPPSPAPVPLMFPRNSAEYESSRKS